MARTLEDNELSEFLDVLGAAQEVGYNLDEHYGKEVKTDYTDYFFGNSEDTFALKGWLQDHLASGH